MVGRPPGRWAGRGLLDPTTWHVFFLTIQRPRRTVVWAIDVHAHTTRRVWIPPGRRNAQNSAFALPGGSSLILRAVRLIWTKMVQEKVYWKAWALSNFVQFSRAGGQYLMEGALSRRSALADSRLFSAEMQEAPVQIMESGEEGQSHHGVQQGLEKLEVHLAVREHKGQYQVG